jgi:hypothetical protein
VREKPDIEPIVTEAEKEASVFKEHFKSKTLVLLILINYPNMGGIVPTQAVGPESCSKRVTNLSGMTNKKNQNVYLEKKIETRRKKEKKEGHKDVKKSNPFEGTPFLKAKQHCTFWYPKTENCAVPISIQA